MVNHGVNVSQRNILHDGSDAQYCVLSQLRSQRVNKLHQFFYYGGRERIGVAQEVLMEESHSFQSAAGFKLLSPITTFKLIQSLFKENLSIWQRFFNHLIDVIRISRRLLLEHRVSVVH